MNFMHLAIKSAYEGIKNKEGGPFGCCIINKKKEILAITHNQVLLNDPTAHAEIQAIRQAALKINNFDLTDCILYTTCEPCPMCLFAIMWANIKEVYYGCDRKDAREIGFRDDEFYNMLNENKKLKLTQTNHDDCLRLFKEYKNMNGTIY